MPRYGELGAARLLSRVLGAVVDHGPTEVAQIQAQLVAGTLSEEEAKTHPLRSLPMF